MTRKVAIHVPEKTAAISGFYARAPTGVRDDAIHVRPTGKSSCRRIQFVVSTKQTLS